MQTRIVCRYFKSLNSAIHYLSNFAIYGTKDLPNIPDKLRKTNKLGYATVKIIGKNLPRMSEWSIAFTGEFKSSPKYGYTFYADSYELIEPTSQKGIIKFLSSDIFEGIGEKTAEAIVREFGKETLNIIETNPNQLLKVKGCSIDKVRKISEGYERNIIFSRLCTYLSMFGLSQNDVTRIYDRFQDDSINQIKHNPYTIQDVKGIGFSTAEKIARYEKVALDSKDRINGAMAETLRKFSESTGNMFMDYFGFEEKTLDLLNNGFETLPVSVERFRASVLNAAKENIIVCRNKTCVYLKQYDDIEDRSAKLISSLLSRSISVEGIDECVNDYLACSDIKLSSGQVDAVKKSLSNRVSIITGGPGTGKTTILKAIISCYLSLNRWGSKITLLAPTGKAARRMSESTGYEASTIHSKLKLFDEYNNPELIEEGLIIVDETSMLDNVILYKLLSAIQKNTQLIFVGDIDQLPSVGVGSILSELISSGEICTTHLTEIFRQKNGGSIVDNANFINNGNNKLEEDDSFKIIDAKDENEAINVIKDLYKKEIDEYGIDNVALLTPLRKTQNGKHLCVSDNLNSILQNEINNKTKNLVVIDNKEFRVDDRVLQWKNSENSANGDIGVINNICEMDDDISVEIAWDNGNKTVENRESMKDITLAYSISIHKSQGSEYDCVIIPMLSSQNCQLFKRNLLYTGITRGKKKVIIVGDRDAISTCINNTSTNKRNTLLGIRTREYCKNRLF